MTNSVKKVVWRKPNAAAAVVIGSRQPLFIVWAGFVSLPTGWDVWARASPENHQRMVSGSVVDAERVADTVWVFFAWELLL